MPRKLFDMRVVLFTGKGGVGKTTVAAATAVRAARSGRRTLVMSTDPAHSLGDSFELAIGSAPTLIAENLWAQQIDAQERLEDNWREIQDYFIQLMNWAGTETIQAEELTVIPGLDEIFALIDVKTHVESGKLRHARGGLRADRGDAPPPVAPRDHELVHRADLPGGAQGGEGGTTDRVADDHAADRGRQGVRRGRAPAP